LKRFGQEYRQYPEMNNVFFLKLKFHCARFLKDAKTFFKFFHISILPNHSDSNAKSGYWQIDITKEETK